MVDHFLSDKLVTSQMRSFHSIHGQCTAITVSCRLSAHDNKERIGLWVIHIKSHDIILYLVDSGNGRC